MVTTSAIEHSIRYPDRNMCELSLTHESSWKVGVSADLAVDFDQTLHDDLGHIGVGLKANQINI